MRDFVPENQAFEDDVSVEETARATLYGLLARLLSRAPDAATLEALRQAAEAVARDEADDVGRAFGLLAEAARQATVETASEEYQNLFIGLGRGELVPFGSYYLTGFLQEKPLAKLRRDMARLGIKAKDDCHDPEDHAASVLEIMGGMIDGRFGGRQNVATQRAFFDAHLASWLPVFFGDLEKAKTAEFYRAVGRLGAAFFDLESAQFEMAA